MVAEILQKDILAVSISSALGGSERSLLEFAKRAPGNGLSIQVGLPGNGPLAEALGDEGIPVSFVDELNPLLHLSQQPGKMDFGSLAAAPLGFLQAGKAIATLARGRTIYSNSFKTHLATALTRGTSCVWHVREFPPKTTAVAWAPICAHRAQSVIANSRAVGDAWRNIVDPLRGDPPAIEVVYNGVDTDVFQPGPRVLDIRSQHGLPDDAFLFGMPAAFASWKGQLEVVQAFESIVATLPNAYLVLVGGEIYDTTAERTFGRKLRKTLETDGTGRILQLGFARDIAPIYREFDCTIHYSLRPEPFGRVLIESMASAVPVIAAAEGGPVEILTDSPETGGGWLCAPRQPARLAQYLRNVAALTQSQLRQVGRAGRDRSQKLFEASDYAESIAHILRLL